MAVCCHKLAMAQRKQSKDGAPLPTEKAAARKKEDDDDVYSPVNKKKRASSSM
jgi:hypothetical protein